MTTKTTAPEPVKSTTQLDLEARQAKDYVSPIAKAKTVGPNDSLVNEDGFVGVSPEYANNANETDAPLASEGGAEKILEDKVLEEQKIQTDGPVQQAVATTEETATAKHAAPPAPTTAPLAHSA